MLHGTSRLTVQISKCYCSNPGVFASAISPSATTSTASTASGCASTFILLLPFLLLAPTQFSFLTFSISPSYTWTAAPASTPASTTSASVPARTVTSTSSTRCRTRTPPPPPTPIVKYVMLQELLLNKLPESRLESRAFKALSLRFWGVGLRVLGFRL